MIHIASGVGCPGMKEVAESISTTDNEKIKLMIVGEGDLYEPLLRMKSEKNLDGRSSRRLKVNSNLVVATNAVIAYRDGLKPVCKYSNLINISKVFISNDQLNIKICRQNQ